MPDLGVSPRQVLRVVLRLALGALLAPWVILVITWYVARQVTLTLRRLGTLRLVFATELTCPRGHASSLLGVFECRGCGALFAGHAFQRCPICGSSCGYTTCEHCGMAVRNPWL